MTFATRSMVAKCHSASIVSLRCVHPSHSASIATSRPILLRYLKQAATVLAALKTGTSTPSTWSRSMPSVRLEAYTGRIREARPSLCLRTDRSSPKRRVPHIHQSPALPIAQPYSHDRSEHNNAESCANHDPCKNPIANRSGRPQCHCPQRGSQYENSDGESHP